MKNWREVLTTYTEQTSQYLKGRVKKTAIVAATAGAIMFSGSSAALANNEFTTVYYVYMGDKYFGTISNPQIIEDMVSEELKVHGESYDGLRMALSSDVSFIPEKLFNDENKADDEATSSEFMKDITVKAEAAAIKIGNEPVAFLKDEEQAEEVIKELKLQYLTKEEWEELEARPDILEPLPDLKTGETRLLNALFSEEVTITKEKIEPEEVMSVKEAMKLLQTGTLEEKSYKVKEGDVLSSIAQDFELETTELLDLNDLESNSMLKVGQELKVNEMKPFVDVITNKEEYKKEKISFEQEVIEDSSMFKGEEKVKQEGKDGERTVLYHIIEENGDQVEREEMEEDILKKPVKEIVVKGTKDPTIGDGEFVWPAVGGYVSSEIGYRWGKMHKGIDIARPSDRTIKAADNGKVISAGWSNGYGNKIEIDHQNGYRTVYAHLDSISVSVGETVTKSSEIGIMGSTGDSTGVHLHFELFKNGKLENPLNYVKQ
ncbi:peptidoglycan DD-metalloendopeptidase family protein [Cytobacillus purgationiresistens]|uniref:Murein DD-endopeptidase MepM/ murein hydrolase activator NlpD n=1 Tax=Cytobacillus purgationiresistens TaxID=863449 RepID=A0ABU0ANG2_9BACI|nr:peptidoglycan DD-metalloendopeptidase family protein [Cytobacillus purgationiresistens]MDQ0271938.1 murein DD-endopeptidase MepM/ murein hydrolase activator NlpD [Cytobacillus purgationiresistens]